jgi:DNA-binding response OmpR family regulator
MRLLIGEQNGQLQSVVADALRGIGYGVDIAKSDAELRTVAAGIGYELMILDTSLSGSEKTESEMIRALRREGIRVPVLAICGNASVARCIEILDSGADDCLIKPFHNRELLARVRALLRRAPHAKKRLLRVGNLQVDEAASEVLCLGRPIDLRLTERRLLVALLRRSGWVVAKETLARILAERSCHLSVNAIEALVSRLRKRFRAVESGAVIHTIAGIGYRLAEASPHGPPSPRCQAAMRTLIPYF